MCDLRKRVPGNKKEGVIGPMNWGARDERSTEMRIDITPSLWVFTLIHGY